MKIYELFAGKNAICRELIRKIAVYSTFDRNNSKTLQQHYSNTIKTFCFLRETYREADDEGGLDVHDFKSVSRLTEAAP